MSTSFLIGEICFQYIIPFYQLTSNIPRNVNKSIGHRDNENSCILYNILVVSIVQHSFCIQYEEGPVDRLLLVFIAGQRLLLFVGETFRGIRKKIHHTSSWSQRSQPADWSCHCKTWHKPIECWHRAPINTKWGHWKYKIDVNNFNCRNTFSLINEIFLWIYNLFFQQALMAQQQAVRWQQVIWSHRAPQVNPPNYLVFLNSVCLSSV